MEIKSSLLKYKEFSELKNSLIKVSEIDGKDKFRVKMVEYINDTSDNNDDMFFYDMLPFTRFLNPSDKAIAYTTPDHIIFLNSPGKVGENVRVWDFIYCHECLHQLWDTFEVGEKIKKAGFEYNHNLLNIASDCVINDYLKNLRKKEPFNDGIFPETLKKEFNVEYDRKNDTQYSLYVKLLKAYETHKDEMDKMANELEQQGENNQSGGSSGSSSSEGTDGGSNSSNSGSSSSEGTDGGSNSSNSNGGENGKPKELTADDAQNAADEAKKNAEDLEKRASSSNEKKLQDAADKAKDAAKRAQEAADKAKECANNGDKEGERKAAEEAEAAANEAKKAAEGSGNKSGNEGGSSSKGGTSPATNNSIIDSDENIDEIRKNAEETIKKYKDKLTGPLGEFLNKCESSKQLKREGLKVNTDRGISGWNNEMNKICKAFVKKKIFQKKRQYEKTYTRIKRGSGFVKFGQPIDPGRKIKEDKMDINVAFYIDRSGSMGNSIDNVFKAVFYIADALKKYFGKDKVVNDTIFESYAFDTSLHKLQFGKKMSASGGTLSFNKLLDHINENTKDFLINVIVTDAQFSDIDTSTIKGMLKEIDGIIIFITNTANETMEKLSKTYPTKLNYILADSEFTLK